MTRIGVLTSARQTRRQIARALHSGGLNPEFLEDSESLRVMLKTQSVDMIIVDCDEPSLESINDTITTLSSAERSPMVVLLSGGANKSNLLEIARSRDISNIIAKHGAVRAAFPVMDERELLVTCEKVLRRNIFGIEKYVGSWGVVCHTKMLSALRDKERVLSEFASFLEGLDCQKSFLPAILTVADELIMNAVVHAPHRADGTPKYESTAPSPDLVLDPHETVTIAYGCDGQRLMLSVSDNFGRITQERLYTYLAKSFASKLEVENRPSGAGIGLTMAFNNLHQLIINVQENVRTEAIAGWYLRALSGAEFRQMAKSFNLFWLAQDAGPRIPTPIPTLVKSGPDANLSTWQLRGPIDENTDLSGATQFPELDLREVSRITSRGVLAWLAFVQSVRGRGMRIRALPEPMVRVVSDVAGLLDGMAVTSVMVPLECPHCAEEEQIEAPVASNFVVPDRKCGRCATPLQLSGLSEHYTHLAQLVTRG